jgi:hypothetical protein
VSWAARLESAPDGGLRLKFSEPVSELKLSADVARHLASLLVLAAEQRQPKPPTGATARRTTSTR